MAEARDCIQSKQSKENVCLFCGELVERGLLKEYRGLTVWICTQCIMKGELGAVMAEAIMDNLKVDRLQSSLSCRRKVLSEIERSVTTTQASFYRTVLYGSQLSVRRAEEPTQIVEEFGEPAELEGPAEADDKKGKRLPEESEVLNFLDTWRSFEEIQAHFEVDHEPLLDMLNDLFLRGYIFKRGSPRNPQYCNTLIT